MLILNISLQLNFELSSWMSHIENAYTKITGKTGIFFRIRNFQNIYFPFIHCHKIHVSFVLSSTDKTKLFSFNHHQKQDIRVTYYKNHLDYFKALL